MNDSLTFEQLIEEMCEDPMFIMQCEANNRMWDCLLYTSPSPRDLSTSRMPSSA